MYNNYISQDYLMHHGIKGMKWGVRHDSQPLGRRLSNHAVNRIEKHRSQKMAETERYKNTKYGKWVRNTSNKAYDKASNVARNGLSSKQKKVLKGVAAGAAIAGIGALSVVALKSGAGKAAMINGAKYLRMAKTDAKIMKIGVKDAVANSKAISSGKYTISKFKAKSAIKKAYKNENKILKEAISSASNAKKINPGQNVSKGRKVSKPVTDAVFKQRNAEYLRAVRDRGNAVNDYGRKVSLEEFKNRESNPTIARLTKRQNMARRRLDQTLYPNRTYNPLYEKKKSIRRLK